MKVSVAWECKHCGKQHLWLWDLYDAKSFIRCDMTCEGKRSCGKYTNGTLHRIGRAAFALVWA
jgi:hypothetical protein